MSRTGHQLVMNTKHSYDTSWDIKTGPPAESDRR